MASVNRLGCLASEFSAVSDFLMVYIEEAHPADGWSFKDNYHINYHRNLGDRIGAANVIAAREQRFQIVVDSMKDEANRAYGGLFERLYIVHNGSVAYQGQRGPRGFRIAEVENWLKSYKSNQEGASQVTVENVAPSANPC